MKEDAKSEENQKEKKDGVKRRAQKKLKHDTDESLGYDDIPLLRDLTYNSFDLLVKLKSPKILFRCVSKFSKDKS